jgi:hypothetical protein
MTRFCITCVVALCASACASMVVETASDEQAGTQLQGTQLQGTQLQGTQLQGTQLQGTQLQGFRYAGATLGGAALANLRVEHGEVVAEQDQVTLRGTSLIGAHFYAQLQDQSASPPPLIEYRVTNIVAEDAKYDPTHTGSTFLYTLEQWVSDRQSFQPACAADADGRRVAIPLAATWNQHGDRVESTSLFTFACTTGVIAKCYRWGYRPWLTGYGDLAATHWTCTRMARADYCGDGVPHTRDGTSINVWDNLPSPGPIQQHGGGLLQLPPLGMIFEAGWTTSGAVCLSRARWLLDGDLLAAACPAQLILPGLGPLTCDTVQAVLTGQSGIHLFNESYLLNL